MFTSFQINAFDIISLALAFIGILLAVIQGIRKDSIERTVLNDTKALLQNIDYLCLLSDDNNTDQRTILHVAKGIRTQATAIIEYLPGKKERLRSYDYGVKGKTPEERLKNRKELMGLDVKGCVIAGQKVALVDGNESAIEDCEKNLKVISYNVSSSSVEEAELTSTNHYCVENYIMINSKLCLSTEHKVFVEDKGWTSCYDLTIGDAIKKIDGNSERVDEIVLIKQKSDCYSVHISPNECLFVNGYLVHNEEEEGK